MRCGSCHEAFDAIEHLRDDDFVERAVIEARNRKRDVGVGTTEVPSLSVRAAAETAVASPRVSQPVLSGTTSTVSSDVSADESKLASNSSEIRIDATQRLGAAPLANDLQGPVSSHSPGTDTLPADTQVAVEQAVPAAIRDDLERFRNRIASRRTRAAFSIGASVLLLGFVGQIVWYNPTEASRRYPQWHGYIEQFCGITGCSLPQRREPSLVRVVSRDVRVHPRYEGALQITATLVNTAPFGQPYPDMGFTLFNVNGQTIAMRNFSPDEYLGTPLDPKTLFEPGLPIQIGLEVLAPDDVAVSFEFTFL